MGGMNLDLLDLDLTRLENNTILELREFAKQLGLKSVTKYRKAQLIELIQAKLTEMSEEQDVEVEEKHDTDVSPKNVEEASLSQHKRRGRPRKKAQEPQPAQLKIEDTEDKIRRREWKEF